MLAIPHNQTWGSWEELLLACAVKRHGLTDWDSVSQELQNKTSLPHLFTTPTNCQLKYHELLRRFNPPNHYLTPPLPNGTADVDHTIPWLDELRKIRVSDLKQEVQRYDVSILSLELKVKRLEEERERELSFKDNGISRPGKPDLEDGEERSENDKKDEPERTGDESDRDNRSVNESNTTCSKGKDGKESERMEHETFNTGSHRADPGFSGSKPVVEHSDDGSSDTVGKNESESVEPTHERKGGNLSDLPTDSAAQSNGGRTRESSDMQSSASLTRKRKRKRSQRKEIASGQEPSEIMDLTAKSQPLVRILDIIRGHNNNSSLFERRLESQETDKYNNVVRQHVDFETVESRLHKGNYSTCTLAFYRDLLLLFNNATLFFPKSSVESIAAHQLRHLVLNEIPKRSDSFPTQNSPTLNTAVFQPKAEPERSHSLLAKPNASVPMIVCRKRSFISAKSSSSAATVCQKENQISDEKKPALDPKTPPIKPSTDAAAEDMMKTNAKDKPVTGVRSLRRSNKNPTNNTTSSASSRRQMSTSPNSKTSLANQVETTPKTDKKKKMEALALEKKRSAADFLRRIKRNSPTETLKSGSKEQKTRHIGKGHNRNERVLRQSSNKKHAEEEGDEEESSPSKRSVGRPQKKLAKANAVSAKRGKESGVKEVVALKRPKKRPRR
ncbi:LOW QUALITY PROTEIN: uncharacterized protein LOC121238389 [Juglans microcarpa x Juglans regia]|uniref:LOW QUALITY PROTEIN: uncharacterized protein LOC121238389 n=1 Tax=Juglans microcarpa x Juglans regia TaxID=2249226 RepID=UPI001B7E2A11|nr:LOW QUALITY PROTEIN: uncharacterized protein LOC121238389 [Juglans microcarpa x Juglans regia]